MKSCIWVEEPLRKNTHVCTHVCKYKKQYLLELFKEWGRGIKAGGGGG
jgi:hypothetical protein